jgi:alginate O-acetyltransferase complex protein AlgI
MTLSRWLRDYLYIPLGGNRGGVHLTYRNLMLTMILGGLWHGNTWNFVIWGAIHGGVLAVERLLRDAAEIRGLTFGLPSPVTRTLQWLVTFHVVCLAWVFFRAETFSTAMDLLSRLGSFGGGSGVVTPLLLLVIVGSIASQFVPAGWVHRLEGEFVRAGWVVQGVALGLGLVVIDVLGPEGVAPFIYFQF